MDQYKNDYLINLDLLNYVQSDVGIKLVLYIFQVLLLICVTASHE
jgi:hypothetical protein